MTDWESQKKSENYAPSAYEKEGFIHACHRAQLEGVYRRYFAGRQDSFLLQLDESKLKAKVIEEPSTGGELYPHIYGLINKEAIIVAESFRPA